MMTEQQIRDELIRVGREVHVRQYVCANEGNFSYRLAENRILATPTMISKGHLTRDDFVILDLQGNKLEGRREQTSEIRMHLAIYRERPDIRCVLHTHAPHATAFAIVRKPIPKGVLPEIEVFVGEVPIADYALIGTDDMGRVLQPLVHDFKVFLLANHGITSMGHTIQEAHWNMEITESYCRVLTIAQQLGPLTHFSSDQMDELLQFKQRLGLSDRRIEHPQLRDLEIPAPTPQYQTVTPPSQTPRSLTAEEIQQLAEKYADYVRGQLNQQRPE